MNIPNSLKLMGLWNRFQESHPKFPAFLNAVKREGLREGTVLEISVTTPEGKKLTSNIKIRPEDLELLKSLREFSKE